MKYQGMGTQFMAGGIGGVAYWAAIYPIDIVKVCFLFFFLIISQNFRWILLLNQRDSIRVLPTAPRDFMPVAVGRLSSLVSLLVLFVPLLVMLLASFALNRARRP